MKAPSFSMAIDTRTASLLILATLASIFFIGWAQAVLLPLIVAVFISYSLDPLLLSFDRLKVPRPI